MKTKKCDHCGRKRPIMAGMFIGKTGEKFNLCHPDFADHPVFEPNGDNPDCYRLVTVYGEEIGTRKDLSLDDPCEKWDQRDTDHDVDRLRDLEIGL